MRRACAAIIIALAVWGLLAPGGLAERGAFTARPSSVDNPSTRVIHEAWSDHELIGLYGPGADARRPALALGDGRAHLVWEQDGELHYAVRESDGWHLDDRLQITGDSPAVALAVYDDMSAQVTSPEGAASWRLHLVYAHASLSHARFHIYHSSLGPEGWHAPRKVSDLGGHAGNPDIAILVNSGDVHVAWAGKRDGRDQIYHARSLDLGQSWHIVQPVSDAYGGAPSLDIDNLGRVWIAWQSTPVGEGFSDIWGAHWDGATGIWSVPERVSDAMEGDARAPKLACGADDVVHLVWEQEPLDGQPTVRHARRYLVEQDAPWILSKPPNGTTTAIAPHLALPPQGGAYIAWSAGDALEFSTFDGSTWSSPETIAVTDGARHVAIAVDEQGGVRAVWSARQPEGGWAIVSSSRGQEPSPTPTRTNPIPTIPSEPTPTQEPSPTQTPTPTLTLNSTATPTRTATHTHTLSPTTTATATATATISWVERWFMPLYMHRTEGVTPSPTPEMPPMLNRGRSDEAPATVAPSPTPAAQWVWEDEQFVDHAIGTVQDMAVLRTNAGDIHIVWSASPFGYPVLYHSHRTPADATWPAAAPFLMGEEPALTLGSDDSVHLVYSSATYGGTHDVFHAHWVDGIWSSPKNVSSTSGTSAQPAVTVRSDGTPIVVWSDTTGGSSHIYYGWLKQGVWTTFVLPASINGTSPDVCVGRNDRVWVGWQLLEFSATTYEVYALYGSGVHWASLPLSVSDNGFGDSLGPRLGGIADRGAFMVWEEDAGATANIYYADNLGVNEWWWSVPVNLSETTGFSRQPSIATSSSGAVAAAWHEYCDGVDDNHHALIRWRRVPGSSWSPAETMATGDVQHIRLALDDDDGVHAIWTRDDASIWYRRGSYRIPMSHTLHLALTYQP